MRGNDKSVRGTLAASSAMIAIFLATVACEPIRKTHGYVPAEGYVKRVAVGSDTRTDVVGKIGRPSTIGAFEDSEWYYISRTTETTAFYAPEATDQQVLIVAFDASGVVQEIDRYGLENGQVINLVTRTTPTRGKRLTFLQQLLGNIGRITPAQLTGDESVF